jgi:2-keto-3-deoxy-L-rhamnonate aldolase RhmA
MMDGAKAERTTMKAGHERGQDPAHLAEGGNVLNGWLAIPSSISAEIMPQAGWDSLCVYLQHVSITIRLR